jgi:adenylylsulfate reductase subunit A
MLERGLALVKVFEEDTANLGARDLHDLLRCWEIHDRELVAEANLRHMLFRKETRWPGYYYRMDFNRLDEENWRAFVVSRRDPETGEWELEKIPVATPFDDSAPNQVPEDEIVSERFEQRVEPAPA